MGPSSPSVRNGIHLGLSFCSIFMAFSVSQNFQTSSDHKKQGANALGILYACFTFANFISSFIVSSLGSKLCLILGSFTYVLFVAANIVYNELLLYLSSGLLGLGASVLWTAQGAYISNCSALHEQTLGLPASSTLGFFNGLFFSIFQVNQLLGNLLAAALFKADVSTGTIFIVMTAICASGALTLLFLNDPAKAISATASTNNALPPMTPSSSMGYESSGTRENTAGSPSELHYIVAVPAPYLKRSKCSQFLSVFDSLRLLAEPRMLILIPIMVYSGLSQTYIFGDFPPLIQDKSTKFFVLAAIGATDALASVAMGKLSDAHGRVIVLIIGFITAGAAILFLMSWSVNQDSVYVFFLVGIVMGISDGVYNTQIYAILGSFFEGQAEKAFANFKLFQAGSTAVAFLLDDTIGFYWKCVLTGSWLLAGMLCLAFYDVFSRSRGHVGSILDGSKSKGTGTGSASLEAEKDALGSGLLASESSTSMLLPPQESSERFAPVRMTKTSRSGSAANAHDYDM